MLKDRYAGTISKVRPTYALALCEELSGTIYIPFPSSWKGKPEPAERMLVNLDGVFLTPDGWRVREASPIMERVASFAATSQS